MVAEIQAALAAILAPLASHRYEFRRNAGDEYEPFLTPLQADAPPLAVSDCHLLLPIGGGWRRFRDLDRMGVHSLFAIPFLAGGRVWIGIGVEYIVPHPTRVAYPISEAYLFWSERAGGGAAALLAQVGAVLRRLAGWLAPALTSASGLPPEARSDARHGPADGETPVDPDAPDYPAQEAWLLLRAAEHFAAGRPFFLRTLLLAPDMRPAALRRALRGRLAPEIDALLQRRDRQLIGVPPWLPLRDPRRPLAFLRSLGALLLRRPER
jgi:hypothetical protein